MINKKIVLGVLLASSSSVAMAAESGSSDNWVGGISYINVSDEDDGLSISLGGIVGSLGYKISSGNGFYLVPEARVGFGVKDDSVSYLGVDMDIELDRFLALSLRGQFELDNGIYLFAAPVYSNAELTVSASQGGVSVSITEDSWEFGFGGGIGYNLSKTASAEVMYEQFDGTDAVSFGLKFNL